jgi:hypothetical protein
MPLPNTIKDSDDGWLIHVGGAQSELFRFLDAIRASDLPNDVRQAIEADIEIISVRLASATDAVAPIIRKEARALQGSLNGTAAEKLAYHFVFAVLGIQRA